MTAGQLPLRHDIASYDGAYAKIGASKASVTAKLAPGLPLDAPLMAIVPLDANIPTRIEAMARLWRALTGQQPLPYARSELPASRRERLAMSLRAVDARHAGATRRDIAVTIFGPEQVPEGVAFDDHHLRSRTARLIRDGLALIAGGYRKLLKS
ncbi:hypothetical protein B1S06_24290 [Rhodopseudomonas palustris]|nr:hypothetical protein B1S06_24290 [Rhodopseudomonas palustris]